MPEAVSRSVRDAFERFDGHGVPAGRAGAEIEAGARFAGVGYAAVMFEAVAGSAAAAETVARWSGRALDPAIAAVFLDSPAELLRMCGPDDLWAAVVEAEPEPRRVFADEAAFEEALAGFGDAADLKSPWFTGHSRGVAGLARAAAGRLRSADATLVYRAGLVHDLGRVAVPAGVWERPGPLRAEDWELAAGQDDVHLLVRWTFRSITTGRQASMTMHHYWRIRDGKIEHFRGSEDTEQTARILTPDLIPPRTPKGPGEHDRHRGTRR